ncbi:hypothetical protein KGD83_17520 [Nocardiopsis akebiae]|uniref:Uncharacterized protein n=1 Tax=Nocardiopsis akebiae TaxID=2831968 RepID=A0ABX8BY70_9ACTN|nr:hypothetical protein [Nocardiopsis akebiae]QUX27137.1 hypothetical protein KGD83_17520 [Nocardiopsis akebiae]
MDCLGQPSEPEEGYAEEARHEHEAATADGKPLRPFRRREVLHRVLYTVEHPGPGGGRVVYTAEVDLGREDGCAELYADGRSQAKAELPAAFPVPGGVIEVDVSLYGVRRVHLVLDDGREQRLTPAPGTIEDLRGRLHRRHPRVSRAIAGLAVAILALNLVLAVPQALELVTGIPRVAELFGSFTSPVALPRWLNAALILAGVLAAVERVLTLRRNRVLDAETLWMNF